MNQKPEKKDRVDEDGGVRRVGLGYVDDRGWEGVLIRHTYSRLVKQVPGPKITSVSERPLEAKRRPRLPEFSFLAAAEARPSFTGLVLAVNRTISLGSGAAWRC